MICEKHRAAALHLPLVAGTLYAWAQTVLTGALLFDTFVLYPNIFADVPQSLSTSMQFLSRASPGSFLPGLGAFTLATGLVALWAWRRERRVLVCFLAGFMLVIAFDFVASALYFWPRNTIMFTEGLRVHSAAKLLEASRQFQFAHWIRVAACLIASCCAMLGLVAAVRQSARNR